MSLHGVGREGELRLTFAQREGRTILTENYSRPPLQVMRAIEDRAGCLCVYMLSPTGGVVQGDRYAITINVGAGSHALVTTQAATKVYKMPYGCAEQMIRIEVQPGAVLEFVPDAAILFADADFSQQIEVRLHPRRAAVPARDRAAGADRARASACSSGATPTGSSSAMTDGLLLHDAAAITPAAQDVDALGVLEGYTAWGSAYLLGDLAARGIDAAGFCAAQQDLFDSDRRDRRDLAALSEWRRRARHRAAAGNDLRSVSRAARGCADELSRLARRAAAEIDHAKIM